MVAVGLFDCGCCLFVCVWTVEAGGVLSIGDVLDNVCESRDGSIRARSNEKCVSVGIAGLGTVEGRVGEQGVDGKTKKLNLYILNLNAQTDTNHDLRSRRPYTLGTHFDCIE